MQGAADPRLLCIALTVHVCWLNRMVYIRELDVAALSKGQCKRLLLAKCNQPRPLGGKDLALRKCAVASFAESQIQRLPDSLAQWTTIVSLDLSKSYRLAHLPHLDRLPRLQHLSLRGCIDLQLLEAVRLPTSIRVLDMRNCHQAKTVPAPCSSCQLRVLDLAYCSSTIIILCRLRKARWVCQCSPGPDQP